jgi:hypothetical protein
MCLLKIWRLFQTTCCHIAVDRNMATHRSENLTPQYNNVIVNEGSVSVDVLEVIRSAICMCHCEYFLFAFTFRLVMAICYNAQV